MKNSYRLLYILAVIRFVLPFLLQHPAYQPHRDEFLYLAEGRHLGWGYMEIPPLLSLFAWVTNLMGGGMFWIKLWPSLFGSFTFLLVGQTILRLGGKNFALLLGWFPFVLDGYMRLFYLFQPNFLDVFFWTAMAYTLFMYVSSGKKKWCWYFGFSLGLGMMSKYSVGFYGASLMLALLLSHHRRIWLKKTWWFSLVLAFLIFLPNLIWQYNHRFPVIHHMQELQEEQLKYINASGFLTDQLMMNFPCVFIWLAGLVFTLFRREGRDYRFIGFSYFFVIALLVFLSGKSYYALGAYPILFAFGAFFLEKITLAKKRAWRYAMALFSLGFGLLAFPLILPVFKPEKLAAYYEKMKMSKMGDFKWEDQQMHPLPQDFSDMVGWEELAMKTGAFYRTLSDSQKSLTAVYCRGYYTAGALNYYRKKAGLPEVISDNASFLLWLPDELKVDNILMLSRRTPDPNDPLFRQFKKITVVDSIQVPYFRENGTKLVWCENGSDSLQMVLKAAIRKVKAPYYR